MRRFSDFRLWCLVGVAVLMAAALLTPTVRMGRNVYHYLVVFDITQSQNVEDYVLDGKPVSRLAFTKYAFRAVLRDLPCGSSVGVGLFAAFDITSMASGMGDMMSQQPTPREPAVMALLFQPIEVCRNFSVIDRTVEQIDWRMAWSDSSDITAGLYATIKKAKAINSHTKVIFFTEGEPTLEMGYVRQMPGKKGEVMGLIVGTGGLAPAQIPKFDDFGNRKGFLAERSRLNEEYLRKLEAETGLRYVRLLSAAKFSADIRSAEFAEREEVDYDIRLPLAALALILVLLAVLL
ncbi:MAG: hypothetical protein Q8Q41_01255 [bacterium]|nr:hypothetical protein [bacterium]